MHRLSPKQTQLLQRDEEILLVARVLVLEQGYYGVSMDRIAKAANCPKGTVYHRFASKEDILVALATACLERRNDMMARGAAFEGRPRERFLALAEGISLYSRLHAEDSQILHNAMGPVHQKASPLRVAALMEAERQVIRIARGILAESVRVGDLAAGDDELLDEIVLGSWGLLEGGFTLIESGIAQQALNAKEPLSKVWRYFNRAADAYGWRPLFSEWDYEESLARIRQSVFPEESQRLYGEGQWYGDRA
ncbi:MAG: TetR/AcrR family transcriptional regulator [Candidatus Hydrogenedentes bacterium]|nr:TetR/AcrR family transcriptional regulator [Candidatus Hydrogenedentota bacterium]